MKIILALMVLISGMFLNSGCLKPLTPQEFAQNQIDMAESAFYKGNYDAAMRGYILAGYRSSGDFPLPENITDEARAGMVDAYLRMMAGLGRPANIVPPSGFEKFDITKEMLYEGFSRVLNDRNFKISFILFIGYFTGPSVKKLFT